LTREKREIELNELIDELRIIGAHYRLQGNEFNVADRAADALERFDGRLQELYGVIKQKNHHIRRLRDKVTELIGKLGQRKQEIAGLKGRLRAKERPVEEAPLAE
jgi:chromosome segregation ATPase